MNKYFDFEKPIEIIDDKIKALESNNEDNNLDLIQKYNLEKKNLLKKIYSSLTSWQKVKIARHSDRPHTLDYIENMFSNFIPLSGDKKFAEDRAIVGGLAKIDGLSVMIIGNEKGNSMEKRIEHNFGMARPEGYRKAQRLMRLAEQFDIPVISFVDTPGAYPGVGAEQRGQAEAIAKTTECCLSLGVPIVAVIIGEGGSGGAVAIGTGNNVLMLENSVYSVISPEGCSSILWKDTSKTIEAASALKLTANDMLKIDVVDKIISEPSGGAHRHHLKVIEDTGDAIEECLNILSNQHGNDLKHARQERYLQIGRSGLFSEKLSTANTVLNNKYGIIKDKKSFNKNILLQLVLLGVFLFISILTWIYFTN